MQSNQQGPEEQRAEESGALQPQPPEPVEVVPVSLDIETVIKEPKKSKKKLIIVLLSILAVLLIGGGIVYWQFFSGSRQTASVADKQAPAKQSTSPSPSLEPVLAAFITPKTGEKWLAAPKKISEKLNYDSSADSSDDCNKSTYYEVGSRGENTIILGAVPGCTGGGFSYLYERTKDGKVSYISHPIGNGDYTKYADGTPASTELPPLEKSVTVDTATHYDSLSAPSKLAFGSGQAVDVVLNYPGIGELTSSASMEGIKQSAVKTYGQSRLQKIERQYVDTKLTAINYVLDLPSGTQKSVNYAPISNDASAYTWSNGVAVDKSNATTGYTSEIGGVVRGCGAVSNAVTRVDDAKDADFVEAGKTPAGQKVYAFKDKNNHVVQAVYKDYKTSLETSSVPISVDDFLKQHAIIAFKDLDGTWLVYSRDQFALLGGCGKPVVYLYPTKTQIVNVRVGADVSVSIPSYNPATGWSAVAQPNGQLTVAGKQFDSLFWEGVGHGLYPGITAGTVVKRADAVATIKSQLFQQGLNQKETSDFLAYWQQKIPNDPYIRLTWFNTAQLDKLAPLSVSPKPDTSIRVFLDMAGYATPIKIPTQKLVKTERKGFTLVEWGGLIAGSEIVR